MGQGYSDQQKSFASHVVIGRLFSLSFLLWNHSVCRTPGTDSMLRQLGGRIIGAARVNSCTPAVVQTAKYHENVGRWLHQSIQSIWNQSIIINLNNQRFLVGTHWWLNHGPVCIACLYSLPFLPLERKAIHSGPRVASWWWLW